MSKSRTAAVIPAGPQSSGIRALLDDPELYGRISDDDCPPADEFQLPEGWLYRLGMVGDEPASLFIKHGEQIHFMVRHALRGYALKLWRLSSAGVDRMFCEVPVCYPEVIRFAEFVGFRLAGEGRPVKKGGVYVPRVRLEHGFHF